MMSMRQMREAAFLRPRSSSARATLLSAAGGAVGSTFAGQRDVRWGGRAGDGYTNGSESDDQTVARCSASTVRVLQQRILGDTLPPVVAQSVGNVLMGGGGLRKSGAKNELCKAFNEAAEEWCDKRKKAKDGETDPATGKPYEHPGGFNDCFYEKLNAQVPTPSFLSTMEREVPALFKRDRTVGWFKGGSTVGQMASSGRKSAAHTTARALSTRMRNILDGYDALQGPLGGMLVSSAGSGVADKSFFRLREYFQTGALGNRLNNSVYPRFYDGVLAGPPPRVVEIKGPTDSFNSDHGRGQAEDLNRLKPKPAVLSCKSCGSSACTTLPGGGQRCNNDK